MCDRGNEQCAVAAEKIVNDAVVQLRDLAARNRVLAIALISLGCAGNWLVPGKKATGGMLLLLLSLLRPVGHCTD